MAKGNKYFAKKVIRNGIKFDSKLEMFFYDLLKRENIPFQFQVVEVLQNKFRDPNGKAVRQITARVDFVIEMPDDSTWYVDTKGFPTEVSNIKYKMLEYNKFLNNIQYKLNKPSTQKECLALIQEIKFWYHG